MFLILSTICSISVLSAAIMMCLCWKKKNEKNDLLGLEGLVTQKNPDENVNHLPSAAIQSVPPDGIVITSSDDIANDALKRPIVTNNPRRSLPDIPFDGGLRNYGDGITYEPSGDNSSDLYATVEPYQNSTAKRHTLPNGIESRPSVSQHSSLSQADDTLFPYARVKEHPYDKLRETEHPYAQVHSSNSNQDQTISSGEGTSGLRNDRASSQVIGESAPNSRSRRSSNQSSVGTSDIPAGSAVAGGIAASQELPYMTPPIAQTNFSGDSQDSSRGYTSITVREPLADIRAQTKLLSRRDLDPHYSTVSDDSDDVYTTIHDPNNSVYTSGSETYAQIQPSTAAVVEASIIGESVHIQNTDVTDNGLPYEHASQLPNVSSLKHVASTHSRQASSSSSVGIIGSPKPEKRQANSPLPPPPPAIPNFSFDFTTTSTTKLPVCKNLDDMYAKVQKNKKTDKEPELPQNHNISNNIDHNYETLRKVPSKNHNKTRCNDLNSSDSLSSTDPGYETLKPSSSISEVDPNYEQLHPKPTSNNTCDINYGYSVVNKVKSSFSDEVKSKNSSSNDSETKDFSSIDEPNYESMTSESFSDPNYALLKSTDSESDPNYESVNHSEPNYESVKYLNISYDQLENESANSDKFSAVDPGYETIRSSNDNESQPMNPSEKVRNCDEIVQV